MGHGPLSGNIATRYANGNHQFSLMMDVLGFWWIGYGSATLYYGICRLGKKERWAALIIAKFFSVLTVVSAYTKYPPDWKT
tara:strand:+ start:267 stop:509 length:243 start_codon:yes stop_codon:yes gene_type:complete